MSFRNGEALLGAANLVADGIPLRGADAGGHLRPGPGREGARPGRRAPCTRRSSTRPPGSPSRSSPALGGRCTAAPVRTGARSRCWPASARTSRGSRPRCARGACPCEVVGLGGLLLEPEVVDVVSTLRVLADPTAGAALVRLLAGPRWRLGPRDLDALGRRARGSPSAGRPATPTGDAADERAAPTPTTTWSTSAAWSTRSTTPATAGAYSAEGYRRHRARCATSCAGCGGCTASAAARPRDGRRPRPRPRRRARGRAPACAPADALLNVDRLVEVAEEFVASGEDPGLLGLPGLPRRRRGAGARARGRGRRARRVAGCSS